MVREAQVFWVLVAQVLYRSVPPQMERWVRWILLRPGFVSLKTDGSSLWDLGVVRSTEGNWIFGFTGHACVCDSLRAELLAILQGLSLCWEHGHRRVELFIDSLLALGLITAYHPLLHQYACIIGSIKSLLRRSWVVHSRHMLIVKELLLLIIWPSLVQLIRVLSVFEVLL